MRKFDEEFKANAVRLVREEGMKIKNVANDLGIGKSTLAYWLGLHQKGQLIKTATQKKEDEEMRRLRKENRILREERDILKKGHGHLLLNVKSRYRIMRKLRPQHSIEKMSKVLGVSKSGYYRFLTSSQGKRAQEERLLGEEIEELFYEHRSRAGSPKIWEDLKEKGHACGRKRVARIMKKKRLSAKIISIRPLKI